MSRKDVFIKNLQFGDTLRPLQNVEGPNGPQSDPAYDKCMQEVHICMFPLYAYAIQARNMCRQFTKPQDMGVSQNFTCITLAFAK